MLLSYRLQIYFRENKYFCMLLTRFAFFVRNFKEKSTFVENNFREHAKSNLIHFNPKFIGSNL
jgi:hypothetical protein